MPDNSAEIARLKAILNSGAKSGMVDGEAVTFDTESIRKQLALLQGTDDTTRGQRPRVSSINFGGCK